MCPNKKYQTNLILEAILFLEEIVPKQTAPREKKTSQIGLLLIRDYFLYSAKNISGSNHPENYYFKVLVIGALANVYRKRNSLLGYVL